MLAALYGVVTGRAPDMLRAYLLAVLVQLVVVNTLAEFNYLQATFIPFFGIPTAVGGVIFGLGMTLAVGCVAAIFTRAGEGRLDQIVAALAFAVGAWASDNWLVQPLRYLLRGDTLITSLHRALGMDRWVVIAIIGVAAILWVIRGHRHPYQCGWDWMQTGIFLGAVGVSAWVTSAATGRPYGLGTLQGSDNLATFFLERDLTALGWNLFVVVGIPIGSFVASRLHGKPPATAFRSKRILPAISGGLLMGLGATLAAGDNVSHGLSGAPLLAVSSLTFVVAMFAGAWAGIRLGWLR